MGGVNQRDGLRRRDGNGHLEACLVHHVRAEGRVDMLRLHVTPANPCLALERTKEEGHRIIL